MLKKILIANRGEIAIRIIRACQELGYEAVAVYSDADRMAPHVRMAHEAYRLGPPPAVDSYLRGDKIIDIARQCGADGIHPGYGFLAENADFAEAVEEAGLTWIGPPPDIIRLMGDKLAARQTMARAGVPLVPGTDQNQDLRDEELFAVAQTVGYPLLVKAAGGGGGKGIRLVRQPEELKDAIRVARREAEAAFGDGRVYLEKYIENARHVEIQLLGDLHGSIIHLGERECSIQRRHQKLVEESPSPAVDDTLREQMGRIAVTAAQAINYASAGTMEFILDQNKNFYFLEMNTRLQVEHPVTEMVTGIDIVKEMLRVASGRKLRYTQADVQQKGWAIECRILAEDPANDFMPSIGRIIGLTTPTGPGVRVDSGMYFGVEVTPYYDSMLGKLIVRGDSRGEAILRMRRALEEFRITGISTTVPLHLQLMNSARFQAGQFDVTFLERNFQFNQTPPGELAQVAAVAATIVAHRRNREAILLHQSQPSPWRLYGRREALDRRLR
ncbi:MAG: acetyl-CoA carboxylase biotin carboxylase subunit [Chloroflexi bacterium]|nr:MAG: acetyl-CoA carboxylase biotin carboxylase subunit [Chloroflexota bacterium]